MFFYGALGFSPMIFHIRFAFGRRTHAKFLSCEAISLIEGSRVQIDLQGIEPDMFRRKLACMVEQDFSDAPVLMIRMNIQMVNEIISHCHKSNRAFLTFNDEDFVLFQYMIAEIVLVLVKEVTFCALKFRKRLLPGNSPKNRYGVEIFRLILADDKVFRHGQK